MSQLRVLQFVNILDRGGTESFIFNNLDEMDRDVVNFDFLVTRNQIEPREDDLKKYGCKKIIVTTNSSNRILSYIQLYNNLKKYFTNCPYDIVHFESNPPGIMATAATLAAYKAGIKVRILHSHGAGGEKVSLSFLRPVITSLCRLINVKSCTYFMAPSMQSAQYGFGNKVANGERCLIIKNPIRINDYIFDKDKRDDYRNALGIDKNSVVIGTVGRISEVKNQLFMLDIFKEYANINRDSYLLFVGGVAPDSADIEMQLKNRVKELGLQDKVVFVGECKDVAGILNAFDAFLFTSKSEALGIAALEAQINGVPVYIAQNGIPKDVEITDNVYWLDLCDPAEKWANRIDKTRVNLEDRMIDINTERIKSVDVTSTAKVLQNKYIELL